MRVRLFEDGFICFHSYSYFEGFFVERGCILVMDTGLFNPLFLRTCYKQLKAVIVTRKKNLKPGNEYVY